MTPLQFVAHCVAIHSLLKNLLELAATRDVAGMRNTHKDQEIRAISAQLYNMLTVVWQESAQKLWPRKTIFWQTASQMDVQSVLYKPLKNQLCSPVVETSLGTFSV